MLPRLAEQITLWERAFSQHYGQNLKLDEVVEHFFFIYAFRGAAINRRGSIAVSVVDGGWGNTI